MGRAAAALKAVPWKYVAAVAAGAALQASGLPQPVIDGLKAVAAWVAG